MFINLNIKKIFIITSFSMIFLFISIPIIYASSVYVWSNDSTLIETQAPISSNFQVDCGGAILIEQTTGKVLFEQNSHEKLHPASVTKIMSILLIMDALHNGVFTLDTKIPCSETASSMGGSQIWLDPKEELTVHEMLKAICVASANDCTVAMAEYIAGTQEQFVNMMNERAKNLGMNDTTFKNCHGLDEDGHLTSAHDIALMSKELLNKYPEITNYTTIWMDNLRDGKSELVNTNKLIRNYSGATGLKTGSTSKALYNLSASATRDNLSLIAVIMKAPTTKIRFAEAQKLLNYGFSNFSCKNYGNKNDVISNIPVVKGTTNCVECVFENSANIILKKGEDVNIIQKLELPDYLEAPITYGDVIGNVSYYLNDELIHSTNIIANNNVDRLTLPNMTLHIFKEFFNLQR